MAKDVTATLTRIVATHGKMDNEAATKWIESLGATHRYRQDVW
jgi:sulfite reductase alpha subunit-like flavoprotein